jgi:hypothetical protein
MPPTDTPIAAAQRPIDRFHAGALGHRLASIDFAYSVSRTKMPAEQLAGFGALFVGERL